MAHGKSDAASVRMDGWINEGWVNVEVPGPRSRATDIFHDPGLNNVPNAQVLLGWS